MQITITLQARFAHVRNMQLPGDSAELGLLNHSVDNVARRPRVVGPGQKVSPGDSLLHGREHVQSAVGGHPQLELLDGQHERLRGALVNAVAHADVKSARLALWNATHPRNTATGLSYGVLLMREGLSSQRVLTDSVSMAVGRCEV